MEEQKIVKAARAAKEQGYQYIASVVATYYTTVYMHYVNVDDIIATGKWTACKRGESSSWTPAGTISRRHAYALLAE